MTQAQAHHFIQVFKFANDRTKSGRILSTAKIGDLYMSRLVISPGVTTGNYYYKKTKIMFYVERGMVLAAFEDVKTKEKKQMTLLVGEHVIHIPTYTAQATKNVGKQKAVLVFFSNLPLRSEDDTYAYSVL